MIVYGRNPVMEAIRTASGVDKILIQKNIEGSGRKIYALAKNAGIAVQSVDKIVLDKAVGTGAHQGVIAYLSEIAYVTTDEMLARAGERGESPLLVLLDGIEDPHNLGAIIRSAEAAGAHGVVIPNRRAVSVTEIVVKSSAGAALHLPIARVTNLTTEIRRLKELGLWIYGLDMDGDDYRAGHYEGACALVVGGEGSGLSRLVRDRCDRIISIPMRGKVNSLNASNAAAIALFEISRQVFA